MIARFPLLMSLLLVASAALAGEAPKPPDGTYLGSAKGYRGKVQLSVTMQNGRITAVKVTKHRENRPRTAIKTVPQRIIEKQSTDVDAVTRATVTSKAIMKAAERALKRATAPALADGTYKGSAQGYKGPVDVQVMVKDGKISAVKILKHKEKRPRKSLKLIPESIVEEQSTDVDAVTRATVTSKAIMKAAASALAQARKPAAPKLTDGIHKGSAEGCDGPVAVEVTVKNGKITAVKIVEQKESQPGKSLQLIPERIIEKQSTKVDAVTGATITSKAIVKAAAAALENAKPKK